VLLTGVFGSGKSAVAVEIGELLEQRGVPYAVIDLDGLSWFSSGQGEEGEVHRVLLQNLAAVRTNYAAAGVGYFVLARAIRTVADRRSIEGVLEMPVRVVRLVVPMEEVERRLQAGVTSARQDDLQEAGEWLAGEEDDVADLTVSNHGRPIREVADEVLAWLGWSDRQRLRPS
jgi:adenylylsulfate kinase-like enzyme